MSPRLGATPGGTEWPGPELGSHNREILEERLGLGEAEIEALRGKGVL
jgi:succinyl-CoA--D-citramalate CoA-transferase